MTAAAGSRTETVSLAEGHNRFTIKVSPRPIEAGGQPLQPVTYRLNIRRQRAPRLAFDPPQYLLMNEGETATYTVELDTRWLGAEVVVNISSDNLDITVSPEQVSISQYDWSERTITVTAADDADSEDDYATIRHIANGGHYNNVGGRLRVEVSDAERPGTEPIPAPVPTPAPSLTPTPAPTPTPTPSPRLPTVATTFITEVPVSGRTVTITRAAGSLAGVTAAWPTPLTRDLTITFSPLPAGIPAVIGTVRIGGVGSRAGGDNANGGRGASRRPGALPTPADGAGIGGGCPSLDLSALRQCRLECAAECGTAGDVGMRFKNVHRPIRRRLLTAPAWAALQPDCHAGGRPRHANATMDAGDGRYPPLDCRHQTFRLGRQRFQQPHLDGGGE